jgi:N utilization substance protein A
MNGSEMLRLVDSISRDRNVDKETLLDDLEQAMVSAARKHFNAVDTEDFTCDIDRLNGQIEVRREGEIIELEDLGRIPAQTAKQVMIQRFREDERASIYNEFIDRVGELTTGMAQRYEGGALVVQIGRAEGFMPRSEQIPGEQHQPGERVRCLILDVRDAGNQVKIVLSRADPKLIQRLFEVEVPEVAERIIEIRAMAREPGHRTKLAVASVDSKVDAVGACVGVRGSRIKNIVDELGGEKIDIVRWNESSQLLIQNALKPAEVVEISLCFELGRATVVVNEDQLSLAIGKRGQNVRLAARLTNWDVDILTPQEFTKSLDIMEETLKAIDGVTEEQVDRLAALGLISVFDVEEVGPEYIAETLGLDEAKSLEVMTVAGEKGKVVAEQQAQEKAEAEARKKAEFQAQQAALSSGGIEDLLGGAAAESPRAEGAADAGGDSILDILGPGSDDTPSEGEQLSGAAPLEEAPPEVAPTDDPAVAGSDPGTVVETEIAHTGHAGEALADDTPADAGTVAADEVEADK